MSVIVCFTVFLAAMITCVILNLSSLWALLYLIPLCYIFTKRWFYPKKEVTTK